MKISDILARGYLPKELPPCFASSDFASMSAFLSSPGKSWTTPSGLNIAKPGSLRRRLDIPNPFAAKELAEQISRGWRELDTHYSESLLSLSRPVSDASGRRAITVQSGWGERRKERAQRMQRARYALVSDVSQFYPSVYTHSLEWALHGKAASKLRLGKHGGTPPLGAVLDRAIRKGQDGQTKGLPVGPDSSLAMAEVLMAAVDAQLQKAHPGIERFGWRSIDDFEVFASTQSQAEDILVSWQASLAAFELVANPRKTQIIQGPMPLEPRWRTELAQQSIRDSSDTECANDLYSLFSRAFEMSREFENQAVVNYALARATAHAGVGPMTAQALQEVALASVIAEPSSLAYAAHLLEKIDSNGYSLNAQSLEETCNDICEYHSRREHGSEVAWSLYMIRRFNLQVHPTAAAGVALMKDNCSLIMLRDLVSKGHVPDEPDLSSVVTRAELPQAWRSEDWLLAYEFARHQWASDPELASVAGWKEMLEQDVAFYSAAPIRRHRVGISGSADSSKSDRQVDEGAVNEPEVEDEVSPLAQDMWMPLARLGVSSYGS